MKPCAIHRQNIAWLALRSLDAAEERALRAHLQTCPSCHAYFEEMSALTRKLSDVPPASEIGTSERFHQQVVRAVRREARSSTPFQLPRWPSLIWRVALPLLGAAAVLVAVVSRRHPPGPPVLSPLPPSISAIPSRTAIPLDLEPTVSNYQIVANASLDMLDDLLLSQGNRNPPPAGRSSGAALTSSNLE